MTTTPDITDEGWLYPPRLRKAHYFRADGRSLCGKYASFGAPRSAFEPDNGSASPNDCKACRTKLDKEGVK